MPINNDSLPLYCLCQGKTFLPMRERQRLPVFPLPTPFFGEGMRSLLAPTLAAT